MDINLPAWIRRLLPVTPQRSGGTLETMSDAQMQLVAAAVFAELTQVNDGQAEKDPQGYLFEIAANLCHEMSPQLSRLPDRTMIYSQLRVALDQLPPSEHTMLMMHVMDGLTYKQIAHRMQLTAPVVLKGLTHAYSAIRVCI
jgi:RNA polymerase sigma-70 factor, ECF subfamily